MREKDERGENVRTNNITNRTQEMQSSVRNSGLKIADRKVLFLICYLPFLVIIVTVYIHFYMWPQCNITCIDL